MFTRTSICLALALVGAACQSKNVATSSSAEKELPEPVHNGKTLSEWIADLKVLDGSKNSAAIQALRQMGPHPKIAPALFEFIQDDVRNVFQRGWAADALSEVGADPAIAIPLLRDVIEKEAHELSFIASGMYSGLEKYGAVAIPTCLELLKSKNLAAHPGAAFCLSKIGRGTDEVVPALREALKQKHYATRREAVSALGNLGPEAVVAVPDLIELINKNAEDARDSELQKAAHEALKKLDPKAAAKVREP